MTWRESLTPLRNGNFAWYYGSRFVNTLGNMMANIALAFAVLDITDSPTALGQVLARCPPSGTQRRSCPRARCLRCEEAVRRRG